jgi:hypothetical protein
MWQAGTPSWYGNWLRIGIIGQKDRKFIRLMEEDGGRRLHPVIKGY